MKESLPQPVREALRASPTHLMINAREVQCGDPTCSPVDVAIAMIFSNGRRAMTGMPMEMKDVRREDVAAAILEMTEELLACHNDAPWTPPQMGPPPLTEAGRRALEAITARRPRGGSSRGDVAGRSAAPPRRV